MKSDEGLDEVFAQIVSEVISALKLDLLNCVGNSLQTCKVITKKASVLCYQRSFHSTHVQRHANVSLWSRSSIWSTSGHSHIEWRLMLAMLAILNMWQAFNKYAQTINLKSRLQSTLTQKRHVVSSWINGMCLVLTINMSVERRYCNYWRYGCSFFRLISYFHVPWG